MSATNVASSQELRYYRIFLSARSPRRRSDPLHLTPGAAGLWLTPRRTRPPSARFCFFLTDDSCRSASAHTAAACNEAADKPPHRSIARLS